MQNDVVIEVQNISKCYQIYEKPSDRLKQNLYLGKRKFYKEFWALQDINFVIKKGESVGIIGRNGSGKSTLLQLLCNIITPTTGTIKIKGRIAALLELGAGFNPEFTGFENVYLNGFLLGLTREEIDEKLDKILAFADIGDFINSPVKTYSSGMFVRLAFSVQICVNPEILIIDEALSVGDIFFQQKCAARMQSLREQGTTLIFVSHDMATVRDLCENALYLKSGQLIYAGRSSVAIWKYFSEQDTNPLPTEQIINQHLSLHQPYSIISAINKFKESACWVEEVAETVEEKNKLSKLIAVSVVDIKNVPSMTAQMTDTLKFRVLYQVFTTQPIQIRISFRNRHNHYIHASGTITNNTALPNLEIGEYAIFELSMKCMIEAGVYTFCVLLDDHESPSLGPIIVTWDYENKPTPWHGMFGIPTESVVVSLKSEINSLNSTNNVLSAQE